VQILERAGNTNQPFVVKTSGMYGDFKELIGSALSDIDSLELEPADEVKRLEEGS